MPFPPGPEQPTAPNAGILRLEPGAHHPEHDHGFAQVWFPGPCTSVRWQPKIWTDLGLAWTPSAREKMP